MSTLRRRKKTEMPIFTRRPQADKLRRGAGKIFPFVVKWVKENKGKLLNYWNDKTIVSSTRITKSMLDSKELIEI